MSGGTEVIIQSQTVEAQIIASGLAVTLVNDSLAETMVGLPGPAGPSGADGLDGAPGMPGPAGVNGQNGAGLPVGGLPGQVPVKQSATDYDLIWSGDILSVDAVNNRVGVNTNTPPKGMTVNHSEGIRLSHPNSPAGYFTDFIQQWDSVEPFYIDVHNKGRILGIKDLNQGDFLGVGAGYMSSFNGVFWETAGTFRAGITQAGNMGVGTTSPSTKLHVAGSVRVGSFTVATVPNAASVGAGSMIYVSNETGGPVMAFSDGTNWRRMTDRAVVG